MPTGSLLGTAVVNDVAEIETAAANDVFDRIFCPLIRGAASDPVALKAPCNLRGGRCGQVAPYSPARTSGRVSTRLRIVEPTAVMDFGSRAPALASRPTRRSLPGSGAVVAHDVLAHRHPRPRRLSVRSLSWAEAQYRPPQ